MRNYKNLSKVILTLLVVTCLSFEVYAQSFVTDNDRPARQWMNRFQDAIKVNVTDTIEEAIQRCPLDEYCEVMVPTITLSKTVHVNRPRTRFTGIKDSVIHILDSADSNGFIFEVEPNTTDVMFTHLNINGERHTRTPDIFGIGAYGSSISRISVIDNTFQGLYGVDNAHAIAFYGTGENENDAIQHIIIQNNKISDMRTGSSESIAINGNVKHWEVINNDIKHVNNIAIDAIGGEGTAPVQILPDGRVAPGPYDAARIGFIENNTVTGLSTKNNPAYGNQESWAAAIYIDGGHSIKVTGNTVTDVPWGLEVGAENCIRSSFVEMTGNKSSRTMYGDILLGGYTKNGYLDNAKIHCDPHHTVDEAEGHGYVSRLDVRNNNLTGSKVDNPTFLGNTVVQYRTTQSTIEPPTIKLNE